MTTLMLNTILISRKKKYAAFPRPRATSGSAGGLCGGRRRTGLDCRYSPPVLWHKLVALGIASRRWGGVGLCCRAHLRQRVTMNSHRNAKPFMAPQRANQGHGLSLLPGHG